MAACPAGSQGNRGEVKRLTSIVRRVAGRFLYAMGRRRIATIRAFHPEGCRFEIRDRVESFRVEGFGGEEEFVLMILDELRPGDTLYDIGACVGMVTIHAAKRGATVVAFEPDPGYAQRLATNLALNGTSVQVIRWAVSDTSGETILFTDGAGGVSPSLRQQGTRDRVTVRTHSIDAALKAGEIQPPEVVKIDIEGAEILALRGMSVLLSSPQAPRTIFLELHPDRLPDFGSSSHEVRAMLESAGYVLHYERVRKREIHAVFRKETETDARQWR
jgi:FkbM family methyltransferase